MRKKVFSWSRFSVFLIILVLSLCCEGRAIAATQDQAKVAHVIERLSFGITPGQVERVSSQGIEQYIQSQLNPTSKTESSQLRQYLATSDLVNSQPLDLYKQHAQLNQKVQQQKKSNAENSQENLKQLTRERNQYRNQIIQQARQAHLMYAVASENQLQEVMTSFWFNHFNIFIGKRYIPFWISDYENQIRTHCLGKFRDLLAVTARHPAMLVYLDNVLNTAPNSPGAKGKFKGLNENYARELMELHTLGVNGGYTQEDVRALATILTGWGVKPASQDRASNGFHFFADRHDFSDKLFLGKNIQGSGSDEVEKALDILASHPATASFISYKLAQYFVADEPPQSLVNKLAQRFTATDGDIKTVLATLFASPEFLDPQYYDQKFKTPDQFLISIIRAIDIKTPNLQKLFGMLNSLSMPPYGKQSPDGYANTQDFWLNPDSLLRRIDYVVGISRGELNYRKAVDPFKLEQTLASTLSADTRSTIFQSPEELRSALILGSPEMMYR